MENSLLFQAVQSGTSSEVQQLLTNPNIDVNATTSNGKEKKTSLYLAVERGNLDIIRHLLSIPSIDVNKKSILELEEEDENIYYFGENSNEPNFYTGHGPTFARMSFAEAFQYCQEHNNTIKTTPLHLAIEKENQAIVQLLISHQNIDVNCMSIRSYCAMRSPDDDQNTSYNYFNTQQKAPLHLAIEMKNFDIVQLLLSCQQIDANLLSLYESGYNFLEKYRIVKSPLSIAIDINNLHIFQMLLNHTTTDASIDIVETESNAARKEYKAELKPLHLAVQKKRNEMVKALIKRPDVDINSTFKSDKKAYLETTALNLAIDQENLEMVRILLSRQNINVNKKHICKQYIEYELDEIIETTPLYMAVTKRNKEIIKMLLTKNEIEVNTQYSLIKKEGYSVYRGIKTCIIKKTPLIFSVENNDSEIADILLIKNDIDLNIGYNYECSETRKIDNVENTSCIKRVLTPLYVAIQNRNVKIVDHLLLKPQIDLNYLCLFQEQNDITRKSAINLARENGNENENGQINNLLDLSISN